MKKKTSVGSKIILTLTMLFFYLPILYIIIFSFNDSRSLTKFGGFSLRWYEKMFADSTMMEAVLYTVIIAVIARSSRQSSARSRPSVFLNLARLCRRWSSASTTCP